MMMWIVEPDRKIDSCEFNSLQVNLKHIKSFV